MKKQRLMQTGLIVVILIAVGLIARQLKPRQDTIEVVKDFELVLVDTQANKVFKKTVSAKEPLEYPMESPFSEGKNAYPVFQCVNDGTIFAFDMPSAKDLENVPLQDPQKDPRVPKCPVCNGFMVKVPELPKGQKSMDIPGPVKIVKPSL